MKGLILSCVLGICATMSMHAQTLFKRPDFYAVADSAYIRDYPNTLGLHFMTTFKFNRMDFIQAGSTDNRIEYRPNELLKLGGGFIYKWLAFNVTLKLPQSAEDTDAQGNTRSFDVQLNLYGRKFIIDGFMQFYRSYYVSNFEELQLDFQGPPGHFPIRDDLRTFNGGINLTYFFNNYRFSYRAAYLQSEKQVKGAGSFLLGGFFSLSDNRADSAILSEEMSQAIDYNGVDFSRINTINTGIAIGYTRTFVFFKNFFLNASLQIGPMISIATFGSDLQEEDTHSDRVGFKTLGRIALGYNHPKYYGGITLLEDSYNVRFQQTIFNYGVGHVRFFVGKRFSLKKPIRILNVEI